MADNDIERRIDAALAERQRLHPTLDRLVAGMESTQKRFTDLLSRLEASATAVTEDPDAAAGFARLLADDVTGLAAGKDLATRIGMVRESVTVLDRRIRRDTLNLGVIGLTKAGKSTLLRRMTGLGEDVIPTSEIKSTTASVSRVYHRTGAPSAEVDLHDWSSFRTSYLAPLFNSADENNGVPPLTVGEFGAYECKPVSAVTDADVTSERFRSRLRTAITALPSYQALLTGEEHKPVAISELRGYLAYPKTGGPEDHRPYHAVREVRIWTEFPYGSARIGLVDLPGPGESGLIDRHFVASLVDEVDLVILIKRPDKNSGAVTDLDWTPLQQAKEAAGYVDLSDFVYCVVNDHYAADDPDHQFFEAACEDLRTEIGNVWRIPWVGANVDDPEAVRTQVVARVLDHLADRIAAMDRRALSGVQRDVAALSRDVEAYASAIESAAEALLRGRPKEEALLSIRADEVRKRIGAELRALANRYADRSSTDAGPELVAAASVARETLTGWIDDGLGRGADWESTIRPGFTVEPGATTEAEYSRVRGEVLRVYRDIDSSLARTIAQLHTDVADVLRAALKEGLVPHGPHALRTLRSAADHSRTQVIVDEITYLIGDDDRRRSPGLAESYGSIFLRVAAPVVQRLRPPWQTGAHGAEPEPETPDWSTRDLFGTDPAGKGPAAPQAPTTDRVISAPPAAHPTVPTDPAQLSDQLAERARDVIGAVDAALQAEARSIADVLAAAVMALGDRLAETTMIVEEYKDLCRPGKADIWREDFAGGAAAVSMALANTIVAGRAVLDAVATIPTEW